jgi:hypothetical protein
MAKFISIKDPSLTLDAKGWDGKGEAPDQSDVWECERCDGKGTIDGHPWGDGAPCPECYDPERMEGTGYVHGFDSNGEACPARRASPPKTGRV